ncbi:MAG: GntR family transcriptional regulator [Fervidobacterium sp.]|nr:GntR family transcriptional regulator [Fervidobacterium sp.]
MLPTYGKILKHIEDLIITGKLAAGDKIPSENELAKMFNTTRMTVRKALDELEKIGIVSRVPGVGTFVTETNVISHKRVGLLVSNKQIMYGIIKFLSSVGIKIFAFEQGKTLNEEESLLKELVSKNIDGLIIEPTQNSVINSFMRELAQNNFPIVFVDRNIPIPMKIPTVLTNNFQGGKLLGEHMRKEHNISKAVFVTSEDLTISSVYERYNGISKGLKKKPDIIKFESIEGDFSTLPKIIKDKNIDCVFFCNDMLAVRGICYILKYGIKIPEEVKVVGFDDEFVAKMTHPKLTTIKQDLAKVGETAASLIVSKLKGEMINDNVIIGVDMVIRNSCGCKNKY